MPIIKPLLDKDLKIPYVKNCPETNTSVRSGPAGKGLASDVMFYAGGDKTCRTALPGTTNAYI